MRVGLRRMIPVPYVAHNGCRCVSGNGKYTRESSQIVTNNSYRARIRLTQTTYDSRVRAVTYWLTKNIYNMKAFTFYDVLALFFRCVTFERSLSHSRFLGFAVRWLSSSEIWLISVGFALLATDSVKPFHSSYYVYVDRIRICIYIISFKIDSLR